MKKVILLFALSIICTMVFAQSTKPQWTKVTSNSPETFQTQLISSNENSIKVSVQVPGFYTTTVTTPRGEAKVITVPKSVSTAHAGEPDMPMTGIPLMIGDKARMAVRVIDAQYMDFEGIDVAPSKGDFSRQIDPAKVPYTYGECYSKDAFFPANNFDLYEPYIIRDFRGQNMAVYPFAYNPVTKTLRVYYNMTVEMYKVDNNGKNVIETHRSNEVKMDPDFKSVYQRHFLNYEEGMAKYTPVDEDGDLLIICYDNFISSMTDFVNWKKTRGINTTIVGTSTAGSSYSAIQTYIRNQYNANNNLTHVLLVGDVAQIPGYSYSGGGSSYSGLGDNAYGQVVGNDIYNDIFIGRFSASSAAQVTTQVNRVITYEKELTTSATWCQNGLGISTSEGSGGHNNEDDYQHIENLRTDLLNYGYNTVYQDYKSVSGYPSSTTTTISNHINSGVGIINYCNHGEQTGWQSHYYMNSNVNALTNNNKLPFIFSVACLVGQYDYSSGDCFAETWMHATNGSYPTGAIGGAFSYISQPWIPPMWAQDEFVDILCELKNNNIKRTLGGAMVNGMMAIFDNYSTSTAMAVGTYQAWITYGDPTLMLRTKTPQAMTVTHNGNITIGVTNYTVNVTNGNGAVATITDASHNILGKATVSNGTANIAISGNLTPGTELTLCVFGYNKVTYLGTINVISNSGAYISLDSYTPNTALIGQSTNLSLTFKNVGTAATSGTTTVTLSSSDSHVNFGTSTKTFNSLAANATTTVSGFSFTLNNGLTLGDPVTLHYKAVNGSNTWEGDFTVTANQIFNVTVASSNNSYGSVSGGGQYNYNQSCTVTATPADGYMFTNWTSNGSVVSTDAAYTFNVTANTNLVANFTVGVMIGSGSSSSNEFLPTYNWYKYSLTEQIYTSAELGGAGTITSIAFYNDGAEKTRTLDFYLKTTTKSNFSSKTDWITVSSSDKVFSGSVTMAASAWTTITFSTPFEYDGSSNLVLVADDNTGSYTSSPHMSCRVFTASNQAIYTYDDNTNFNPSSPSASSYNALLSVKNQLIVTKEPISTEPVSITVSANPANAGTVTGAGTYEPGTTVTLTATANEGYTFSNWTRNGVVISSNATYSFTVSTAAAYVANFTVNSYTVTASAEPAEYGTVTVGSSKGNRDDLVYDFEDGWQGWTTFQGNTTSPNSWMHNTAYPTSNNDFTTGYGYNNSDGFMLSESYISGTSSGAGQAVTPDNYLVSPQVRLGGSISFYAGARNTSYCAEKFSVMVSTTGNTNAASFTTVGTWTLSLSSAGYNATPYTVDLSAYSGMGYVAIRHWDCYDQWFLAVDNVTIVEGPDNSTGSGNFNHGETCVLTATPNEGYYFINWTENGTVVSSEATYSFTVTADRDLVANFSDQPLTSSQTISLAQGWNWWSTNLSITLADLKDALVAALPNGTIVIKAQDGKRTTYNGSSWKGQLSTLDVKQMYEIQVSGSCSIVLNGAPVNPADNAITLYPNGYTWIAYSLNESLSVSTALQGIQPAPENGDMIKAQNGFASFNGTSWKGSLKTLEPGKGYIYKSASSQTKTLTYTNR